ncbi:N-acetyltransferase [Vibrio lentus]|nr:N-acetyltransferase [Vibrio lentus]
MSRGVYGKSGVLKAQITDITCGENHYHRTKQRLWRNELKDDVFVGPLAEIQKNSVIGNEVRLVSYLYLWYVTRSGDWRLLGTQVMFANDVLGMASQIKPRQLGDELLSQITLPSVPMRQCCLSAFAKGVVIGAGSVVTKRHLKVSMRMPC